MRKGNLEYKERILIGLIVKANIRKAKRLKAERARELSSQKINFN